MASPSLETLLATLASSDVEENVARLVDVLVNTLDARYRGRPDVLRRCCRIRDGSRSLATLCMSSTWQR